MAPTKSQRDPTSQNSPSRPTPEQVFGTRLRNFRTAQGVTQERLAAFLTEAGYQMHQTTVAKVEAGTRPVRLNEAAVFATVLRANSLLDVLSPAPSEPAAQQAHSNMAAARAHLDAVTGTAQRLRGHIAELEKRRIDLGVELDAKLRELDDVDGEAEAARASVDEATARYEEVIEGEHHEAT